MGTLEELPEDIASWTKWKIGPGNCLTIQVPLPNEKSGSILIDTGSSYGVALNSRRWNEWRKAHLDRPATLTAYFTPASGLVVREECWADNIVIGGFSISDVPVMQCDPSVELRPNFEALLGWFALSRLDIIIDGEHESVYTRPVSDGAFEYSHNRMGAVFVPNDMSSKDLVAQVLEASPAYTAGIRNGDILLSIGDLDVTKWQTDPNVLPLSRFWERAAGTKLELTVARDGTIHQVTVILDDILCPDASAETPSKDKDRKPDEQPAGVRRR